MTLNKTHETTTGETTGQKITRYALGAGLIGMGILHFQKDKVGSFASIVPPWVPGAPEQAVYASGLAELTIGGALLASGKPKSRQISGLAAAALFAAVYPANIYQFRQRIDIPGVFDTDAKRLARLPLQIPMIAGALYVARKG